eukprot:1158009-Pelagomonas_calceolata.AAC.4
MQLCPEPIYFACLLPLTHLHAALCAVPYAALPCNAACSFALRPSTSTELLWPADPHTPTCSPACTTQCSPISPATQHAALLGAPLPLLLAAAAWSPIAAHAVQPAVMQRFINHEGHYCRNGASFQRV